nr:UDP-glucuronosyltransferase 2B15-like [Onthophagus taurus]
MKTLTTITIVSIYFSVLLSASESAKILSLFPAPSYSHVIIGETLSEELARRGHQVTLITAYEPKKTIKNLNDIKLNGFKEQFDEEMKDFNFFDYLNINEFISTLTTYSFGYTMTKNFYEHERIQKIMKFNEKFDLIIVEHFFNEAVYGLCYHLKVPCVAVSAVATMIWSNRLTGNVGLASYVPQMTTTYSPKMTFFQRMHNLALYVYEEIVYHTFYIPKHNAIVQEHIPNAPHIYNLITNVSLLLVNSHPALGSPQIITPNVKEVGGIHVEGLKNVTLPDDIQKFLDNNKEVIYFALGSNAQSKDIPKETLNEIINGLKKWGKPVLWKFEDELPEKLDNVKIAKWFPQTAVLAHKNVVGFITHCGRLSSLESLYYGVPMIAIPLFAEQAHNAAEMVHYGFAVPVEFKTLKAEKLYKALVEITSNTKYTKEAQMRSKAIRKRNGMDEAVYWIEHVLEFKGASYLKNAGVDLPWYQFWMVDVVAVLIVSFLGINAFGAYLILKSLSHWGQYNSSQSRVIDIC